MAHRCLTLLALALLATSAVAQDRSAQWSTFESIRVHASQAGVPALDCYLQSSRSTQDFQIDVDIADVQPQHGTLMMIAGRIMLSKGLKLTAGAELGVLDQPLLMSNLVGQLIGRVLPGGPYAVAATQKISHVDTSHGIEYATPSAQGSIPAPWSVEGAVRPTPEHSYDFDLLLKWADPARANHAIAMNLRGNLRHQSDFRLDDSMTLEGFSVFDVESSAEQTPNGSRLVYVATAITDPPKTIGDLRRRLTPAKK